jgi:adenine phosphoribosyltransferase
VTDIADLVASRVIDVPDFPKPGIMFKDVMPIFGDASSFAAVVDAIVEQQGRGSFDVVAGIEARGFVLAGAIAYVTGTGVVPVRKAGKLPRETFSATYALEYGEAALEVHADAFTAGMPGSGWSGAAAPRWTGQCRVLVVDDVLATGGTAEAALGLVERAGGTVAGFSVLLELSFLDGRNRLAPRDVHALLTV